MRVAIVGTGNIARLHVEALRALDGPVEIVAGVDLDAGLATAFCAAHGIPFADTDVARALAHTRPELVLVCTPPGAHLAPARAALAAGAHVVVEKPPTLSLREFDELAAAQPPGGPYVATVFQHRFGSGARRLRALMDGGVLGRPLVARCDTLWYRPDAYFDPPWRGRWHTEGGGPTMGHGIHQMDLLCAVLGDWTEVSALARRQARPTATEDLSMAHVTFANGAVASVVNSLLSPREESYLRFDFERATVEVRHLYGYGDDDWHLTPAPGHEEAVTAAWKAGEHGRDSGHTAQFEAVVRAIREGAPLPVRTDEARRTLSLVAAVYASAFGGRPVSPDDLRPGTPHYERMRGDGPPWREEHDG